MMLFMEVSRISKPKAIETGIRLVVSWDRSEERMRYGVQSFFGGVENTLKLISDIGGTTL